MAIELREMMIYDSPPELGALWTDVSEMMKTMGEQQKVLLLKKMRADEVVAKRRAAIRKKLRDEAIWGVILLFGIFVLSSMFLWVAYDRQQKYPQYGNGLFPKTEKQRRAEAEPQIYIGR